MERIPAETYNFCLDPGLFIIVSYQVSLKVNLKESPELSLLQEISLSSFQSPPSCVQIF